MDTTRDVVCTNDMECVGDEKYSERDKVRMQWERKYYYGSIKTIKT